MIKQIINCQTGEIKNVNTETGETVEVIQPAIELEQQPTNEEQS